MTLGVPGSGPHRRPSTALLDPAPLLHVERETGIVLVRILQFTVAGFGEPGSIAAQHRTRHRLTTEVGHGAVIPLNPRTDRHLPPPPATNARGETKPPTDPPAHRSTLRGCCAHPWNSV